MDSQSLHNVKGYQMLSSGSLTQSLEDYLEIIFRLCASAGYTRIGNVASQMGVGASSASKMVQKLGELGFVFYERYGMVRLTPAGERSGAYLVQRHAIVGRFYTMLGGSGNEDQLREAALMEHNISAETVLRLDALVELFDKNPPLRGKLMQTIRRRQPLLP